MNAALCEPVRGMCCTGEGETLHTDLNECEQGWHCSAASSPGTRLQRSPLRSEATAATLSCWMVQRDFVFALVCGGENPAENGAGAWQEDKEKGISSRLCIRDFSIFHAENYRKSNSIHRCPYIHGSQNFKTTWSPHIEVLWEIAQLVQKLLFQPYNGHLK